MTVLTDKEILDLCLQEKPLIYPYTRAQQNPASYDVTLGNTILVQMIPDCFVVPLKPVWEEVDISGYTKDNPWMFQRNDAILAQTSESFNLPDDIAANFLLKSSRARELYQHMFAGWCDPGWHGSVLTLELINLGRYNDLPIYPGLKIGQMVFHKLSGEVNLSYSVIGNYNNHNQVKGSQAWQFTNQCTYWEHTQGDKPMEINYSLTTQRLDQVKLIEPRTFGELELYDFAEYRESAPSDSDASKGGRWMDS